MHCRFQRDKGVVCRPQPGKKRLPVNRRQTPTGVDSLEKWRWADAYKIGPLATSFPSCGGETQSMACGSSLEVTLGATAGRACPALSPGRADPVSNRLGRQKPVMPGGVAAPRPRGRAVRPPSKGNLSRSHLLHQERMQLQAIGLMRGPPGRACEPWQRISKLSDRSCTGDQQE